MIRGGSGLIAAVAVVGALAGLAGLGCGDDGGSISVADARTDAPGLDAAVTADATATADASPACLAAADALAAELFALFGGCTAVVRLEYETRDVLGYALVCGVYQDVFEVMARMRALADTGFGGTEAVISPPSPLGAFVFWEAPGGAAAVSADIGRSVFGGSIGAPGGPGDYTHPQAFRDPADLAAGCPPAAGFGDPFGYDLRTGAALDAGDVSAAVAAVRQTAIPSAFGRGGRVFSELVLLYPRVVQGFDPSVAEWVVLVNGGVLK